jgi:hypothetical protein
MRNVSDKSCIENQNTHFIVNFGVEVSAMYEIMWKNIVERAGQGDNVAHEKWDN